MPGKNDLDQLLRSMGPEPGVFAFVSLPDGVHIDAADIAASIREPGGLSVVVERGVAERAGLTPAFVCQWITLTVHSDLGAVGLTAAVSRALADAGIACNVIAGTRHDHLYRYAAHNESFDTFLTSRIAAARTARREEAERGEGPPRSA